MKTRQEIVSIFVCIGMMYVILSFSYGFLITLNNGEQATVNIITEVKYIGYPINNFDLQRFNLINKIGGGRSLYLRYVFKDIKQEDLEKFYSRALTINNWKSEKDYFTKNNLNLEMNIIDNKVDLIFSSK